VAITVNLDVMLAKRKRRLGDLADAIGISIQNLSVLKTGRARAVRFSTLSAICRELECQPGDILEYTEGEPPADQGDDVTSE
jgi:putative transcriptional regulator